MEEIKSIANTLDSAAVLPLSLGVSQIATVFFVIALLHTFMTNKIAAYSHRFRKDSMAENLTHFLSEVEVVFGFWAFVFLIVLSILESTQTAVGYLSSLNFTEPVFVFVIMCMAATRPVIAFSQLGVSLLARALPLQRDMAFYLTALTIGPLLGSLITEPAAMTIVALILKEQFYERGMSDRFKYATLGLLFVNISIGGTLTHFAAPPVLMVAGPWGWNLSHMLFNFGWKAALAVFLSTSVAAFFFRQEFKSLEPIVVTKTINRSPVWLLIIQFMFIFLTVLYHNVAPFIISLFLIFLGWCEVTKEHQSELKLRESLLVGFFLGGLVTLGNLQSWWLQPLVSSLDKLTLSLGATVLTSFTDNAALTYLGTLVTDLSDAKKYALVSGAVAGGGLTVIANAPNPAGYGILQDNFGEDGINPGKLFLGALPFTIIACAAFLFL